MYASAHYAYRVWMTAEEHEVDTRQRQALIDVLGVNTAALDIRTRAAIEALAEEVIALRGDADQLRRALNEAALLADHDSLCPVFNRRAFEREVRREIALAARAGRSMSLLFIDIDNFKHVNDAFGHAAGDDVLVRIAQLLKRQTREIDIVGRLGGDEFGIVLSQANRAEAMRKADEICREVDRLAVSSRTDNSFPHVRIGASCGVAEWQPGQTAERLLARADQAMYASKKLRKAPARSNP